MVRSWNAIYKQSGIWTKIEKKMEWISGSGAVRLKIHRKLNLELNSLNIPSVILSSISELSCGLWSFQDVNPFQLTFISISAPYQIICLVKCVIFSELQFNYNPFHFKFYLRCFPDSTSCITNHFLVLAQILTHHSYIPHPYEIRLSSIPRCDKIKFIWVQG